MRLLRFFATRRFNYVDAVGIIGMAALVEQERYGVAACWYLVFIVISLIAERKAGIYK